MKAPLGLILFLYIGLLSGITQSQPNRNSRMDSEWKTKRGRVEDDAIIVDNDDELDSSNSNGEKKELFITGRMNSNNRMASLEKRNIVSVDNAGQTHPGTPETGDDWPEYFRPLPKAKREIVNVDNEGQVSKGEPETEGSEYFRPLPKTKRNMMKYAKLPLSEKRSGN